MFEFDWINLLQVIGGIMTGGGIVAFTKSGRIKAKADAMKVMAEGYEERIKSLHTINDAHNANELKLTGRIAQLDSTIDDKTEQIRNLTEKLYQSEQEINRVQDLLNDEKDLVVQLTNEHLRVENNLQLELAVKKCEDIYCPYRKPPTKDTPPMPDMTKDEYHAQKRLPDYGA